MQIDDMACQGQTTLVWSLMEIPGFLTLIPWCTHSTLPCFLDVIGLSVFSFLWEW